MPKRRRYASEPFGPAVERLMNETGVTYRALASKTGLSAGYLNHLVHGNRPGPVERRRRAACELPGRRARVLPRVPAAGDHREARVDARPGRPPVSAFEHLTKYRAARLSGWPVGSRQATTGGLGAPPSRTACQTALLRCSFPVLGVSSGKDGRQPLRLGLVQPDVEASRPQEGSPRRGPRCRAAPPPGCSRGSAAVAVEDDHLARARRQQPLRRSGHVGRHLPAACRPVGTREREDLVRIHELRAAFHVGTDHDRARRGIPGGR